MQKARHNHSAPHVSSPRCSSSPAFLPPLSPKRRRTLPKSGSKFQHFCVAKQTKLAEYRYEKAALERPFSI